MNKIHYPKYHQVLTINQDGKYEYISTGATISDELYISLPTILGQYDTTDPTIRKYLTEKAQFETDYFYSDGKLFIKESFLKTYWKHKNIDKETFHPYRKTRIKGAKLPYTLPSRLLSKEDKEKFFTKTSNIIVRNNDKQLLLSELKSQNWDFFITIHTRKLMTEDEWSYTLMKFIDLLSNHTNNKSLRLAYSTEYSIKESGDSRVSKYQSQHRHCHMFLNMDSEHIKLETIKIFFLRAMNRKKFHRLEYHLAMYDKSLWGANYILKEYNINKNSFSLCVPIQGEQERS